MIKKFWRPISIFLLGIILLLFAVCNSVDYISSNNRIDCTQEPYCSISVDGTVQTKGLFKIKKATVTLSIVSRYEETLAIETVTLNDTDYFMFQKTYPRSDLKSTPYKITAKVTEIQFDNSLFVVLSVGVIGFSLLDFFVGFKKFKKEQAQQETESI